MQYNLQFIVPNGLASSVVAPFVFLRRLMLVGLACLLGSTLVAQQARTGAIGTTSVATEPRQYRSSTVLGDALIQIDPETRSLIIITDDATHVEIDQVIRSLDRPKPQVLINVLFIEVTHSSGFDLGIEGSYAYEHSGINQGTVSTSYGSGWGIAESFQGGMWRVISDDWQVTLRALAQQGRLEVLSRPSILARNNQEAIIVVGEEIPFITSSRFTELGGIINTVQYAEVGIILRVTPFITSEDMVEMIVAPEISTLTERTVPISENVNSPVIAKRSAETVVVTPNGKTVVIGGLMQNTKRSEIRKVPVLGDIPLLGMAFRRTIRDEEKKELLIFLTPYIVQDPRQLEEVSRREIGNTRLAPRAFPPDVIERHMEGLSLEDY